MIVVLASLSAWADVRAAVGGRRCILAGDQEELLQLADGAHAVILEAPDPLPVLEVSQEIRRQHPFLPVILATEQHSANLHHFASVPLDVVLFPHQITARLPAVLERSIGTVHGLQALGEECLRNEVIPAPLRHLLACALTAVPPPRTVQHLAGLLNSDPSTIRRHWRRGVNPHGIQRVKDLVDWIVLLHALSAKRPGLTWRLVARQIGTHQRTLRRLAVRLTDYTLGSMGSVEAEQLLERFAESVRKSVVNGH